MMCNSVLPPRVSMHHHSIKIIKNIIIVNKSNIHDATTMQKCCNTLMPCHPKQPETVWDAVSQKSQNS